MMKKRKLQMLLLAACIFLGALCISPASSEAKSYTTKSAVRKEIKKLTSQKSSLSKKLKKQKKKEQKLRNRGIIPLAGTAISINPLIVEQIGTRSCYWIQSGTGNIKRLLTFCSGTVKTTKKTKTFYSNGIRYTCILCRGIKSVSYSSANISARLEKVNAELKKLKNTLKNSVVLSSGFTMTAGTSGKLDFQLKKYPSYNKVSFKSSDKSIVSVSGDGTVRAEKPGKATITAICSVSKKKSRITITVVSDFDVDYSINGGEWQPFDNDTYAIYAYEGDTIQLKVTMDFGGNDNVSCEIISGSSVKMDENGLLRCYGEGGSTIRVSTGFLYLDIPIRVQSVY